MPRNIKIKQFSTSILLLLALFLIFSPLIQAHASVVNPNEPCNNSTVSTSTNQPCRPPVCTGTGVAVAICNIQTLLNSIIPVLISLGIVYFIWGVVQYVIAGGDEAKTKGRDRMIYGLIGLAVIVGLWGLVNIVTNTFGIGGEAAPTVSLISGGGTGSACDLAQSPKFPDLVDYITNCIISNSLIPLMFGVAVVFFIWGAIKFLIIGADDEKNRSQGKQFMIWGIVALTVMIGVWGLVKILAATFGINTSILPTVKP